MKKNNIKKLFLKALIIGGLTFTAINSVPIKVEASHAVTLNKASLSYDQQHYIKKYSEIFNLNYNYVCEVLCNYIDNKNGFTQINGVEYDNEEVAILTFMYQLAYKPDKLGISKKEVIKEDSGYEMELSHEEAVYYYSNLLEIDPEIALSISYAECGTELDSNNYLNNNNPAGIGPFMKFNNKEEGIIYYVFLLKNGYKLEDEADKEFFNCIASTYCPDNPKHWISLTTGIYNNVNDDYLYYNEVLKEEYSKSKHIDDDKYLILDKLEDNNKTNINNINNSNKVLRKIKSAMV